MRIRDWSSDVCSSDLTVETGGKQGGSIRHGRPPRSRYRIASTIRRIGHLRGRPTCEGGGKNGSSTAPSASVKSLGKSSEERRVGNDCVRKCRFRWSPYH